MTNKILKISYLLLALLSVFGVAHADYTSNLSAHYTMDSVDTTYTNGGSVNDTSGNSLNASMIIISPGTGAAATGVINEAGHFTGTNNGTDSGFALSSTANLAIGLGDFSVAVWVKSANNGFQNIISTYNSGTVNNGYALYWNAGSVLWGLEQTPNSNSVTSSLTMDGTTWHHLVATYSQSGRMTLYVDGSQVAQKTTGVPTGAITNQKAPQFGRSFASNPAQDIYFDDYCIYSRELSSTDVASLYASAAGCVASSPSGAIVPISIPLIFN